MAFISAIFCNTGEVCTGDPGSDRSGVVHLYSHEGGLPSGVPSVLHHSGKKQSHRNTVKYGYSAIFIMNSCLQQTWFIPQPLILI